MDIGPLSNGTVENFTMAYNLFFCSNYYVFGYGYYLVDRKAAL